MAVSSQVLGERNPSTINATKSTPDKSMTISSPNALSVGATKRRENADRLVDAAVAATCCPTGSGPRRSVG
jgi:hypothetical protein